MDLAKLFRKNKNTGGDSGNGDAGNKAAMQGLGNIASGVAGMVSNVSGLTKVNDQQYKSYLNNSYANYNAGSYDQLAGQMDATGSLNTNYNTGLSGKEKAKGIAGAAMSGAQAGSAFGPWGALIGAAAGGIAGGVGAIVGQNKAKDAREELAKQAERVQQYNSNSLINNSYNISQGTVAGMNQQYFSYGGSMGKDLVSAALFKRGGAKSNGTQFSNGLIEINSGGTHETNPNEGVPAGVDANGVPNLVEEGETIYKVKGLQAMNQDGTPTDPSSRTDYVFSNRITPSEEIVKKYRLSKDMSMADASKKLAKESEEMPNDPIAKATLDAVMLDLANDQEAIKANEQELKAQEAMSYMTPADIAAMEQAQAMQSMPQGQPMQAPPQEAMMQGMPIMAKGGAVNRFDNGGSAVSERWWGESRGYPRPWTPIRRAVEYDRSNPAFDDFWNSVLINAPDMDDKDAPALTEDVFTLDALSRPWVYRSKDRPYDPMPAPNPAIDPNDLAVRTKPVFPEFPPMGVTVKPPTFNSPITPDMINAPERQYVLYSNNPFYEWEGFNPANLPSGLQEDWDVNSPNAGYYYRDSDGNMTPFSPDRFAQSMHDIEWNPTVTRDGRQGAYIITDNKNPQRDWHYYVDENGEEHLIQGDVSEYVQNNGLIKGDYTLGEDGVYKQMWTKPAPAMEYDPPKIIYPLKASPLGASMVNLARSAMPADYTHGERMKQAAINAGYYDRVPGESNSFYAKLPEVDINAMTNKAIAMNNNANRAAAQMAGLGNRTAASSMMLANNRNMQNSLGEAYMGASTANWEAMMQTYGHNAKVMAEDLDRRQKAAAATGELRSTSAKTALAGYLEGEKNNYAQDVARDAKLRYDINNFGNQRYLFGDILFDDYRHRFNMKNKLYGNYGTKPDKNNNEKP